MSFASHDEWRSLPDTGAINKLASRDLSQFFVRSANQEECLRTSSWSPTQNHDIFTLPTGRGKTSSFMVYALRHAMAAQTWSENIKDRLAAIHMLAGAGKHACLEALPLLREALGDPSERVRAAAAEALELLGEDAPIDALVCALTDFSWQVRTAAAQALGNAGTQTPIKYLVKLLKQERDENVREAIVRALGKRGHGMPVDVVISVLRHDPNWLVRTAAAWALGELKAEAPTRPLLDALRKDQDESVRAAAIKALGKRGDQAFLEPLLAALEDPEEEVRDAAVWALQQLDPETRGFTHWGPIYHFEKQLSPQAEVFLALADFLSDKKGWIGQVNLLHTARGPVLHLNCSYQNKKHLFQEAVFRLVKKMCLIEPIDTILNGRDTIVQGVLEQALETRKHRPWLDLVVVSFVLACSSDEPGKVLRVIISGMSYQQVREQDTSVLDQLFNAWTQTVEEPPICGHPQDLADLKVWYQPGSEHIPQLAVS